MRFEKNIMLEEIIKIVLDASLLMQRSGFIVKEKGDAANIVTSSDLSVQNFLCSKLSKLIPGCGFICEEENIYSPDKEYVWIIDPIDGTANYARGIDHCCISVALKHRDNVTLGVVYCPWRDELFYAETGKGAFLNGKRIHVSDRPFREGILFTAMSTYRKEFAGLCNDVIMETFMECNDYRRYGTAALELSLMAEGWCDLYFELRLQPWDYAAALLILEEAGGIATNLNGEHPRFTGPDLVCAANTKENQEHLLSIIRKHIPTLPYSD